MFSKKSITLIELLISISLLGLIILGVSAFDVAGRKFLSSSERKTKVLNEATYVLEHLDKNISIATGSASRSPIEIECPSCFGGGSVYNNTHITIRIWQDTNNTPADFTDDSSSKYIFNPVNNSISFKAPSPTSSVTLTSRLVSYSLGLSNPNTLQIDNLTLRYDPQKPANPATNPEVTLSNITLSTIAAPAQQ